MSDSLLFASEPISSFRIFGIGFLAGSLFAILIMLIFDWISSHKSEQQERDEKETEKKNKK